MENNTVLGKLVNEQNKEYDTVRAKITVETKKKAEEICEKYDITLSKYLGMIIEESEIDKVHKKLQKNDKKSEENESSYVEQN